MCGVFLSVPSFCCLFVMDVRNNKTAEWRYINWETHKDTYIINSESATKIKDFAFNLHHFTQWRRTTRSERTLICFSDFKNINSDITNVFNQILILYMTTTMIHLDGSWLQYMSTPWRWSLSWEEMRQRKENCAWKLENLVEFRHKAC
jgi:hypothetical protein